MTAEGPPGPEPAEPADRLPPPPQSGSHWEPPRGQAEPWAGGPTATGAPVRPGPVPLRPMNVGDVLDGAFRLLRARWRTMLVVAAVVVVPVQLLSAYYARAAFGTSFREMMEDPVAFSQAMEAGSWVGDLVTIVYMVVLMPVVVGAAAWVAAASMLGADPPWQEAVGRAARRTWALVASWGVVILAMTAPLAVAVGIVVVAFVAGNALGIVVGVLLVLAGVLAALAIWALFALAPPAIMTEQLGAISGLGRSARLVRQRFWPVLGTVLLAGLMTSIVSGALSAIPSWFAFLLGDYGWLLAAAGSMIASLVTLPVLAIVLALLYVDARIRHEGLDLHLAADQLGTSAGGLGR